MTCKSVITIGRQYGSGGREIGKKLAEELGIPCYDKELLERAAKESGLCKELFENHDEKPTNSFLYSLVMDTYSMGYSSPAMSEMPINHKIFLAQFNTIKEIAREGPCVIVGRCADYALADFPNLVTVFIYAGLESKIARITSEYDLSTAKAKELIIKTDKRRASYYNYYSNKKWGHASEYNICLDSSVLGIDGTVSLLKDYIALREAKKQ
jgi:cytidylate kinase